MSSNNWTEAAGALPDDDTLVLIALDNSEVWPGVRDYGRWIYLSGAEITEGVTHWMHLPPAPAAMTTMSPPCAHFHLETRLETE